MIEADGWYEVRVSGSHHHFKHPTKNVADGSYTDLAGNLGTGDVLDGTDGFVVDIVPPTLAITTDDLALAAGESAIHLRMPQSFLILVILVFQSGYSLKNRPRRFRKKPTRTRL